MSKVCATLMKEKEQCICIDTERFVAILRRCENRFPNCPWSTFFEEGEARKLQRHPLQPAGLDLAVLLSFPTSCSVLT